VKIGVVGGSGFVGRHVVRCLLAAGSEVVTVDARAPSAPAGSEVVLLAELDDERQVVRAADACGRLDALVWLAATIDSPPITDERAVTDFTVMVEAPIRFLDALTEPPRSVVYASSIEVYGVPEVLPVAEGHPTNPTNVYGAAKLAAEHYLRISLRGTDSSLALLRLAFIYGPGQHEHNVIPRFLAGLRRGEPPSLRGNGAEVRDDVYVGDVARAVELAVTRRSDGVFNVATGRPHTLLDIAEAACDVSGLGLRPSLGSEPSRWVDRWYEVSRAADTLGFEARTSLETGLRSMWSGEETA
jgi:UDP-glucose 4-epimerase